MNPLELRALRVFAADHGNSLGSFLERKRPRFARTLAKMMSSSILQRD